jgi:drug/metabolite transporter (DMT)-like permease
MSESALPHRRTFPAMRAMQLSWEVMIPLCCAFTYVIAALMLKRASALGVGAWRIGFLANWAMLLAFLPWAFLQPGATGPLPTAYWQPLLNAVLFFGGQLFMLLSLQNGDVSVNTSVMGTKVIMVALLSHLLRAGEVPLAWWIGAVLSSVAIALLHVGDNHADRARVVRTGLLAFASAVTFSFCDVILQKWSPPWGSGRYLLLMFGANALYSFAFIPFFRASLGTLEGRAMVWTLGGAAVLAVNNAGIALAIALWRRATSVNILYSFRGLVSLILVWAIGHWFANEEKNLSPRVFRARLAGAGLMIASIVIVLV